MKKKGRNQISFIELLVIPASKGDKGKDEKGLSSKGKEEDNNYGSVRSRSPDKKNKNVGLTAGCRDKEIILSSKGT